MLGKLKVLFIWVLVFFVGFFILRICLARITINESPQKSIKRYTSYSKALLAENELDLREGLSDAQAETVQRRAKSALLKAPLTDTPLLHVALSSSLAQGKLVRRDLFQMAKDRNVHNTRALKSLISIDYQNNNIRDVVSNLDALMTLNGENLELYYNAVADISMSEEGNELVGRYLKNRPVWATSVLGQQIKMMRPQNIPLVIKSLSNYTSLADKFVEDKHIHEYFLKKLMSLKAYDNAYSYWKSVLPKEALETKFFIHDYNFKGSIAPIPFNWVLLKNEQYFAEIEKSGGLYISYKGKTPIRFASQILKLETDREYRLVVEAEWTYRQRQGLFDIRVQCLPSGNTISTLKLDDEARTQGDADSKFIIPHDGCDTQRLGLVGSPGQYSSRIWAKISAMKIFEIQVVEP